MKILFIALTFALTIWEIPSIQAKTVKEEKSISILSDNIVNFTFLNKKIASGGRVTTEGLAALEQDGFTTIIDLRTPEEGVSEEQENAKKLGLEHHNIPVTGKGISDAQLESFIHVINNADNGKILVHCASGNRVGAMWARYRLQQGASLDIAVKEGRKAGMRKSLEQTVRDSCKNC